jgi:hypothetical protein
MEMNFPHVPNGGPLEAGMFGFGFNGPDSLLDQMPANSFSCRSAVVVPIIRWITERARSIFAAMTRSVL